MQQEILFYVIVPIIIQAIYLLKKYLKIKNQYIAIFCLLIGCLLEKYLKTNIFYLNGNGRRQSFRIGIFIIGIAFGYLYKYLNSKNIKINLIKKIFLDMISTMLISLTVFTSSYFLLKFNLKDEVFYVGWSKPLWCALGSGILIILVLLNSKGLVSKILSNYYIAYIGKISYVIYLVHFFIIPYVKFEGAVRNFLVVYFVSICIAVVSYNTIEKWCNTISIKYFNNNKIQKGVDNI